MNIHKRIRYIPWVMLSVTGVAVFILLYMAFYYAPTEKFMGHVQRLMYFHVPSAIVAFFAFGVVFAMSIMYLLTKQRRWDYVAFASAEIGVLFTTLALITGSFWARPVWNAWWVWDDPRLVTSLILWFIYVAYLFIRTSVRGDDRSRVFAAVFGILGFIDVPIVYFSIKWWRTIHPNVIDETGVNMPQEMFTVLLVGMGVFLLIYVTLLWCRTRIVHAEDRLKQLRIRSTAERG